MRCILARALAALVVVPVGFAQTTLLVTLGAGGQTNAGSLYPEISADGRRITYQSGASNLVDGDTNGFGDIFVFDALEGTTRRASVSSAGVQSDGNSLDPALSLDGRVVAYFSYAANLVAGDTNETPDVFVHDLDTGATVRASVATGGAQATGSSRYPSLSSDGRLVAFESSAPNLVPGDVNALRDVFVHDRATGATVRASVGANGEEAQGESLDASISPDGRYVAFESDAPNLVPGDTNGCFDVFVKDLATGAIVRASVGSGGVEGNGPSVDPSLAAGAVRVCFTSEATNLVPSDANGYEDIFVHELATGTTERVNIAYDGSQAHLGAYDGTLSADGSFVAFFSGASNLVPDDVNTELDIFVRDLVADTTERVSVGSLGQEGDGSCFYPAITPDGRFVAFDSYSANLVVGDENGFRDVFLHDRASPFQPFCAGDGSLATACPCANFGLEGHGCESSAGSGGASFVASGTTSPDAVRLDAAGMPASSLAIFVQADATVPAGAVFGDGISCLAGRTLRLFVKSAAGGAAAAPSDPFDPPLARRSASLGDSFGPGDVRSYQVHYRDTAAEYCTPSPFNATNAVRVQW